MPVLRVWYVCGGGGRGMSKVPDTDTENESDASVLQSQNRAGCLPKKRDAAAPKSCAQLEKKDA